MARPTEPHEEQADWTPQENTVWANVRSTELTPTPWTTTAWDNNTGNYIPVIRATHAVPSVVAEHELGLPPGTLMHRAEFAGGLAEPSAEQLDTAEWGNITGWRQIWEQEPSFAELGVCVPTAWQESGALLPGYMTVGELTLWHMVNGFPEPPDDPEPPPIAEGIAADVLAFAGIPQTPELMATTAEHAESVRLQVRAYTRRGGFDADTGEPVEDVRAVIVSATARSVSNPTGHTRIALGTASFTPGVYAGWTLPELAILNSYRKRWA